MTNTLWSLVEEYARLHDVKPNTLRMWRERGVPHRCRADLVLAARAKRWRTVTAADFGPMKDQVRAA